MRHGFSLLQVAAGLQIYFDKSLQHMLLYQEEEQQNVSHSVTSGLFHKAVCMH